MTKAPSSSGVWVKASKPISASFFAISGSVAMAASSLLRRWTTSGGRLAGPNTPFHEVMSNSGTPASCIEGRLGRSLERSAVVTASARSEPALTWLSDAVMSTNIIEMRPPMMSVMAGGVER